VPREGRARVLPVMNDTDPEMAHRYGGKAMRLTPERRLRMVSDMTTRPADRRGRSHATSPASPRASPERC